jgi:hypothetical protein
MSGSGRQYFHIEPKCWGTNMRNKKSSIDQRPAWEGIGAQLPPVKKQTRKERGTLRAWGLLPPSRADFRAVGLLPPVDHPIWAGPKK